MVMERGTTSIEPENARVLPSAGADVPPVEVTGSDDEKPPSLPGNGSGSGSGNTVRLQGGGSKRQLATCRIEAHKIQRRLSPKKKALDPLRYLPDGGAYYALFTIAAYFEPENGEEGDAEPPRRHAVHRSYKQFSALHARLLKTYPKSNVPRDLPTMRTKRYDNEYIEQKRSELTAYLAQLMLIPEVKSSNVLREFLEAPAPLSDSSDDDEGLLVPSRMLEGLPGTIVTVRAGQSFSVTLPLSTSGDVASWQFTTKKHNIGFSVTFEGELVRAYSREGADPKPVKGFYRSSAPGTCTLTWDNTYTWSKAKMLIYWAEVEKQLDVSSHQLGQSHAPSIPASSADATAPADESDFASTSGSSAAGKMDNRRSGFIEQSRSNSMHPRRLVNSSISLITKPFIHTTGGGGEDDGAAAGNALQTLGRRVSSPPNLKASESQPLGGNLLQGKAGSLIIQRSVKFRGRNWYRKWFVLDPRKCVLRYYDSETAARRGLSLAKLNLTNKHASLAITSSLSLDAAPTPYMFLIRTRKRCWKVCAPSQSEYNEWENAISTAILAAQLSRRGRSSKKAMRKAARSAATLKDPHAGGSGEEAASVSGYATTGSSLATTNSSLAHGEGLRPIEESDDDDDEFEAKEDDESDDSDSDSDSDSDDEPHASESDVVEAASGTTRPYATVDTAALANVRLPDLKKLPMEWKLGFVAVLNVLLLSVRSAPAVVIVLVLFVVDWYLLLKYMKRSWRFEKDVTPSSSTKAKAE